MVRGVFMSHSVYMPVLYRIVPLDLLCVMFVAFKHFCSYQVIRLSSRKSVSKYLYSEILVENTPNCTVLCAPLWVILL